MVARAVCAAVREVWVAVRAVCVAVRAVCVAANWAGKPLSTEKSDIEDSIFASKMPPSQHIICTRPADG